MGDDSNFSSRPPLEQLEGDEIFAVWKDRKQPKVTWAEMFAYATGNFPGSRFRITPEGGYAISLYNKTGAPSVKGSVVTPINSADESIRLVNAGALNATGIVYEDGVPDGDLVWVVVSGMADILLQDTLGSISGNWVIPSATVAGRADATATSVPAEGLPEHQQHFSEIGHSVQTVTGGTDVLCRCIIHFN